MADHGEVGATLPADGGDCEEVLARFVEAEIDLVGLASGLQEDGANGFVRSWNELIAVIASKSDALQKAAAE